MTSSTDTTFDITTHQFIVAEKQLKSPMKIGKWKNGRTFRKFKFFIEELAKSVLGKSNVDGHEFPPGFGIAAVLELLGKIETIVDETELVETPGRFGNKAFRDFYEKFEAMAVDSCKAIVSTKYKDISEEVLLAAGTEISAYLLDSFGNSTRIDYGSGHEMAFIAFLYCLFHMNVLDFMPESNDRLHAVLLVFRTYLNLCRKIQTKFRLEPAGSQGVHGLDDYQFCCYIFGAAQLVGNNVKRPSGQIIQLAPDDFPREAIVSEFHDRYLFLEAVHFILQSKQGPFSEHSNKLWNISGVQLWEKVHTGLIKMYHAEVLVKFPIVQHFYFGSILPFE